MGAGLTAAASRLVAIANVVEIEVLAGGDKPLPSTNPCLSPYSFGTGLTDQRHVSIWKPRRSQMDPLFSNFVSYELLLQAVCSRAVAGRSSEDIQYIVELAERLCELMREVEKEMRT